MTAFGKIIRKKQFRPSRYDDGIIHLEPEDGMVTIDISRFQKWTRKGIEEKIEELRKKDEV